MDEDKDPVALVEKSQENPKVSSGIVKEKTSSENSEYDSVDSYSDEEEQPSNKARSRASGLDSHSESEGSVTLEREEGDGQESAPLKKIDDDEDKKNPQYIPKRGTFYEHDDRTAEDIVNQEEVDPEKAEKDGKKKIWQDKKERWTHDKFNDKEQAPKSRTELVAIYGYDIRNEDAPPRARRRRRYGRGPNKYTRNWEDEEAYTKPPPVRPKRGVRKQPNQQDQNKAEFPPLGGGGNDRSRTKSRSSDSNQEDNQDYKENEENEFHIKRSYERQDSKKEKPTETYQQQFRPSSNNNKHVTNVQDDQTEQQYSRSNQPSRVGTGRVAKPKREIKDSDYRGFTAKIRQQRGIRTDNQKVLPPRGFKKENDFIQSQNFTNKSNSQNQIAELEKEINQLNIQDGVYKGNRNNTPNSNQNRQGSVPPRLQNTEPKGSKRYSSMRQRSLPETSTPPAPPANFSFYPTDYNSTAPPPATQQPLLPTPMPPPTALVPPQVPVSAAPPPLLQAPFPPPAAFAAQPPPQAYLQAPPPTFMAPPAQPQIVSYVTQAQPAYVPGYQGQFNAVTQPTELYQPQGGITYYSADQQIIQRAVPLKRPKAAIPIVAPTDFKEMREHKEINQSQREETSNFSEFLEVQE